MFLEGVEATWPPSRSLPRSLLFLPLRPLPRSRFLPSRPKDKIRLTPAAGGEWTTSLELAPGEYQYRLIVDGEWRDHAEAASRVPNSFGTQNCVLVVA